MTEAGRTLVDVDVRAIFLQVGRVPRSWFVLVQLSCEPIRSKSGYIIHKKWEHQVIASVLLKLYKADSNSSKHAVENLFKRVICSKL